MKTQILIVLVLLFVGAFSICAQCGSDDCCDTDTEFCCDIDGEINCVSQEVGCQDRIQKAWISYTTNSDEDSGVGEKTTSDTSISNSGTKGPGPGLTTHTTESNEQYVVYEKKSSDDSNTGNSGTKGPGPGPGLTTYAH